ncbi:MAG: hypothetical protein OXN84_11425, partial [Albidovulum sp.]|nr:hypothetical protein [Albidovulum sp.]
PAQELPGPRSKTGVGSGGRPRAHSHEESHPWRDCTGDERNGESGRIAACPLFLFFRIWIPLKAQIGWTD